MISIQLRPATLHDAAQLSTLATTIFAESYQAMIPTETLRPYLKKKFSVEELSLDLSHRSSHYVVASHNEALIGFSKLSPTVPPSGLRSMRAIEMVKLYVAKPYHGFGVGARLMKCSISAAKEQGYESIWLCVWQKNERAIAFYRKWGFEKVGMTEIFVGDVVFDDWVLQRGL